MIVNSCVWGLCFITGDKNRFVGKRKTKHRGSLVTIWNFLSQHKLKKLHSCLISIRWHTPQKCQAPSHKSHFNRVLQGWCLPLADIEVSFILVPSSNFGILQKIHSVANRCFWYLILFSKITFTSYGEGICKLHRSHMTHHHHNNAVKLCLARWRSVVSFSHLLATAFF